MNQDVMQELMERKGKKDRAGLRYGSTKGNHQGSSQHVGPLDRSARLGVEPPDLIKNSRLRLIRMCQTLRGSPPCF